MDNSISQDVRKILNNRYIKLAIIIVVLVLVIIVVQALSQSKHKLSGTVTLYDTKLDFQNGESCYGSGGYDDLSQGASVSVRNGSDKIVATTTLSDGTMISGSECEFSYALESVPKSDIYQVEVSKRGNVPYSYNDIKDKDFVVNLEIGK